MPRFLSGRSKLAAQTGLTSDRYRYLSVSEAEPNLGDPLIGPSSYDPNLVPPGQQYIVVSVDGQPAGERYWIPNQGGVIPGSISVFEENVLVGGLSSTTQLNFVGKAITAEGIGLPNPGVAVTVRFTPPGNENEILFVSLGSTDFDTDTRFTFDDGFLTAGDRIIVGSGGTVITTTGIGSVGIGVTEPTQKLHLDGNFRITGTIYDTTNQPGNQGDLIAKTATGGLLWIAPGSVVSGAGGTIGQVQFHNASGLVDGADNFYFDFSNNRVGIGSTQPTQLLDVLGVSTFSGGVFIDNLKTSGISTIPEISGTVTFTDTTDNTLSDTNTGAVQINGGVGIDKNLTVGAAITTLNLGVSGIATISQLDLNDLELDNLKITGISSFGNVEIQNNTISTKSGTGNLILDADGTSSVQVNDPIFVNKNTESTNKDSGSIITEGGIGVEKSVNIGLNLNVGSVATVNALNINTSGAGEGDLFSNGGSDGIFGVFNNTNSGKITFNVKDSGGTYNDILSLLDDTVTVDGQLGVSGIATFSSELQVDSTGIFKVIGDGSGQDVILASAGGITTTGGDLYIGGDLYVKDNIFYDDLSGKDMIISGISTINQLEIGQPNETLVGITSILDEDDLASDLDTALATQQSIKAYVDNQVTAQDLDFTGDTGTGSVDLDSQTFTIAGTTNEIETSGSNQTLTIGLPDDVTVSGNLTVNGNTDLGDANSDTVTFTARVDSSIIPSADGTLDLGSSSLKWNDVHATTFNGAFQGNADTATALQNAKNFSASGDATAPNVAFDGTANVDLALTLANTAVTPGSYGSSTQVGVVTVDSKGRVTAASNTTIDFGNATVNKTDNLVGGAAGSLPYQSAADTTAFLAEPNVNDKILSYNNTTNAPIWIDKSSAGVDNYVNSVSFSSGTLTLGRTGSLTDLTTSITFVSLSDTPANYTSAAGKVVKVNSSGNALEFAESSSAGKTYTLTAVDDGDDVTLRLGDGTTDDDVKITAGTNITIDPVAEGGFTIAATGSGGGSGILSDLTVDYTNRSSPCTLPITVTEPSSGTKQINIPDNSNAFGVKYVQTSEPTGTSVCDGDIWYDTTPGSGSSGGFVTGMIMMFSGTSAPTGWVLCNGSNGTPDLRDRFIVGATTIGGTGTYPGVGVGSTGGSADAVVVSHNHAMRVVGVSGSGAGGVSDAGPWGSGSYSTDDEGVSGTNKNLPPYYALAFIMKT